MRLPILLVGILLTPLALANESHRLLMAKSVEDRSAFLALAVEMRGESCPTATRIKHKMIDKENSTYWAVNCSSGVDYLVMIEDDAGGTARAMPCSVVRTVLSMNCWD